MRPDYRNWLEAEDYDARTIDVQLYRVRRVEQYHGNLDEHFKSGTLADLIGTLRYSLQDERDSRSNPSSIPITGSIRNNLASYRGAVERYRTFLETADAEVTAGIGSAPKPAPEGEDGGHRFGLEKDMQVAIRREIGQLEPGLSIIDNGAERSVDSGFIDITARDALGTTVVIELKAGTAGQRAIAQILSYMGDVAQEEQTDKVIGILVASDFDAKARSAARMIPNLRLRKYSMKFLFSDGAM